MLDHHSGKCEQPLMVVVVLRPLRLKSITDEKNTLDKQFVEKRGVKKGPWSENWAL